MSLVSFLLSPISTYIQLTVSEPCGELRKARHTKKVYSAQAKEPHFSLLAFLQRQKKMSSAGTSESTPVPHVTSVTEHYYRDWH